MVRRKTILVIVSLFVILAMVIVISHIVNEAKNNAMMEYAKQNLEMQKTKPA